MLEAHGKGLSCVKSNFYLKGILVILDMYLFALTFSLYKGLLGWPFLG